MIIKTYTEEMVKNELRNRIFPKYQSYDELAEKINMSVSSLNEMVNGNKSPGKRLLNHFGIKKKIIYLDESNEDR